MTDMYEKAWDEAAKRYPIPDKTRFRDDDDRETIFLLRESMRIGFVDGMLSQVGNPVGITDEMVENALCAYLDHDLHGINPDEDWQECKCGYRTRYENDTNMLRHQLRMAIKAVLNGGRQTGEMR